MAEFDGFPCDTLKFLRALKKNNNREWFQKNKQRYESAFVEPAFDFIAAIGKQLKSISPCFHALPKKTGGSLMRIYRDTRFAKDKSPYKTNIGIHFRHEAGKDVHAPGFYVHIEPKSVFIGAGIYHPEPKVALLIRESIVEDSSAWKRATKAKTFAEHFELDGESLKRPPRGFDAEHPFIDDLKRKDFIAVRQLTEADIEDPDFAKNTIASFKKSKLLLRFLCQALELPF